jgi:hypothetical protein
LALNVVCYETAKRPELGAKRTLRARRECVAFETHKRSQVLHATLDVELQARRDRPASLGKQPWGRVFRLYGEMALEAAAELLCWSKIKLAFGMSSSNHPGGMQEHIPRFRIEKKAEEWGGRAKGRQT